MRVLSFFIVCLLFITMVYLGLDVTNNTNIKKSESIKIVAVEQEKITEKIEEQQVVLYSNNTSRYLKILGEDKNIKINAVNLYLEKECLLECLTDLKAQLFSDMNNKSNIKKVLRNIVSSKPQLAMQILLESITLANERDDQELLLEINKLLKTFGSTQTSSLITKFLENKYSRSSFNNLPVSTKNVIIDRINNIKERNTLVPVLAHVFLEADNTLDEFFSGLDYPEMYSIVALEAKKKGDYELKKQALKKVLTNHGENAIQSLILFSRKNTSQNGLDESYHLAKNWGLRYSTPNIIEAAKSLIHSRDVGIKTKVVAIALLSNIEDREEKDYLFDKIKQYSKDEKIISYIDYSYQSVNFPEIDELL